ncbi:MAG TPA: response regulator [Anaerolineales bacterium]|nr:response regulator [Anaerolineales bacterium]
MAKILLAEDDPTMVSLLQTLLKMEGFETVTLEPDADITGAAVRERPDILLMDVHLGQQSGMDVIASIRRNPQTAGIRVVMTSGLDVREACLRQGANDFLLKPFMPAELIGILNRNNDLPQ